MKCLFPQTYNMILELDKLERLMPSYSYSLMYLSKLIRQTIWDVSNENRLVATLHGCNLVFGVLIKTCGEHIDFLEMYVDYLDKHSSTYTNTLLTAKYDAVRAHIAVSRTQDLVKEHWNQMNPYFRKEYLKEDLLSKDLTLILDDIFDNIVNNCPEQFLLTLENAKFKHLLRGRRKEWHCKNDLCAPSIEVAKANNIINRWNPPDKRYLYLVAGKGIPEDIETACEEMRIQSGEKVTLAKFVVRTDYQKNKIFDLDYESISRKSIFEFVDTIEKEHLSELISQMIENNIPFTQEHVKQQVALQHSKTQWLATAFAGKLLLKELVDGIFVPLDEREDTDNNKKDQCYKSFHILAEYFVNRGYAGICYPSTRMKLIDKQGLNLVLFNADSAEPKLGTFQIIVK